MRNKSKSHKFILTLTCLFILINFDAAVSEIISKTKNNTLKVEMPRSKLGTVSAKMAAMVCYPKHNKNLEDNNPEEFYNSLKKLNKSPKVALVLSGGGAKGLAHIGVLKIIDELGLKVGIITGTSMGSIVGGLYASNYSAEELKNIVLDKIDWDEMLSDEVDRRSVPIDEKDGHNKYISYASFPITKKGIQLPTGIKRGQKLTSKLSQLTLHVQHIKDFDKLPIPFRCVGTDIETGKPYVLKSGSLPEALRASMAIPSVFTPINISRRKYEWWHDLLLWYDCLEKPKESNCKLDYLLVDGGVVRNLPVQDTKDLMPDIIIAVDVGARLYKKNELNSFINIIDQSISFRGDQSTKVQQMKADVLIKPTITGFSSSEFKEGKKLIEKGVDAGESAINVLRAIAQLQKEYQAAEKNKISPLGEKEKINITAIKIRGLHQVSENLVRGKLQINEPAKITSEKLMLAIDRIYASGFFERVTYQVLPDPDKEKILKTPDAKLLIISVTETSGVFLKLGFSYDLDMNAAVLANITIRNLAGQGSKFSLDARLSKLPGALLSYFIHTGIRKPGIGLGIKLHYDKFDISTYKLGDIQAVYDYHNTGLDVMVQTVLFNYVALGIGVQKDLTFTRAQVNPSDPLLTKNDTEAMNYYAYLMFDNLDDTLYPSSGLQFYGEAKYITNHLTMLKKTSQFPNFFKFTVKLKAYIPLIPKHIFSRVVSLYIGFTAGIISAHETHYFRYEILKNEVVRYKHTIPPIYENYMGGLYNYSRASFPFTGLNFMQITGKQMLIADAGLQVEIWDDLFVILRGSVGRVQNKFFDLFREKILMIEKVYSTDLPIYHHLKNDLKYGYGITLGYNSLIGPIEITLMRGSESDKFLFHANIGYRF